MIKGKKLSGNKKNHKDHIKKKLDQKLINDTITESSERNDRFDSLENNGGLMISSSKKKEKGGSSEDNIITKFSLFFVNNFRISLIIIIASLFLGFVSYTSLLKREGFPSIAFPIAVVSAVYPVNDVSIIDTDVAQPLEDLLKERDNIDTFQTSLTPNGMGVTIVFTSEVLDVEAELNDIEEDIKIRSFLPEEAIINFNKLNVSSLNGIDDVVLNIGYAEKQNTDLSRDEFFKLQELSESLLNDIQSLEGIRDSRLISVFTTSKNDKGEEQTVQETFNSVVVKEDGELNSYDVVGLGFIKDPSIGAVEFSKLLNDKINEVLEDDKYTDLKVITGIDPAELVNKQISSLEGNVLSGLLVLAVMLFLIIGWRSSIIITVFIPIVLSLSLISFTLIGFSINTITLFGLILVLGIIADDAIIVMEAIESYKRRGIKGLNAVKTAINDIGLADVAGSVTTILVFVPLAFTSGVLGEFIRQVPLTVIITLIWSLIIGLSVVSWMSNALFRSKNIDNPNSGNILDLVTNLPSHLFVKFGELLASLIDKYIHNILYVFGVIAVSILIVVGFVLFVGGNVGTNLFPPSKDSDDILIEISYDDGTTIEEAEKISKVVVNEIKSNYSEFVEKIDVIDGNQRLANISLTLTNLNNREEKSPKIAGDMEESLSKIAGGTINVSAGSTGGPPPSEYALAVKVYSDDAEVLKKATDDIKEFVKEREINEVKGKKIKVNKTNVTYVESIQKEEGRRYAQVQVGFEEGFDDTTTNALVDILNKEYSKDKLGGLGLTKDDFNPDLGQQGDFASSFDSVIVAFFISVLVMYAYLVIQLRSFSLPILVFVAVPFTLPGVYSMLLLTSNDFSFFVSVGFVALFGVVVNNSIIIVDYANSLIRNNGSSIEDAVVETIKFRTRPILATTLTTLGGLLPLALTDPFWESLAFTLIFGLLSSLILILLTFPAYYVIFQKVRKIKDDVLNSLFAQFKE